MTLTKRTVAFSRDAANLFFHILTGCNLSCSHCYINPDQHGHRPLPEETLLRWLAVFADRCPGANLIFLGGEPTLHPALPDAVREARRLGYGSVTIDTNGYLFNDILDKVTPESVDYISFSLDGATAATNDRQRGEGCFEHCVDGIRRAVAGGFHTSLIYTVSRENIDELPQMPPLLADLGIERFFIQVIGLRGRSAEHPAGHDTAESLQLDPRQWLAVVPPVAETAASMGLTVTYPKVYLAPGEPFECAGNVADNYFVFPNGRVYRCPLCEDHPIHAYQMVDDVLVDRPPLTERDFFGLDIPEGCVMNRLIQPGNIIRDEKGHPRYRVACCLLKEEMAPG